MLDHKYTQRHSVCIHSCWQPHKRSTLLAITNWSGISLASLSVAASATGPNITTGRLKPAGETHRTKVLETQPKNRYQLFICNVISQSVTSSLTRSDPQSLRSDTAVPSYTHLLGAPPSHRWGTGRSGGLAPPGSSLKGRSSYRPAGPASARTQRGRPPACPWEGWGRWPSALPFNQQRTTSHTHHPTLQDPLKQSVQCPVL